MENSDDWSETILGVRRGREKQNMGKAAVTERIIELLYRNLQEVFGEGDAARRRAAIDEIYTDDCILYVQPGVFVGRDALDKFAGDLRATHPQFVYTPHGEAQALHNAGVLAWSSGPKGEAPDYTGQDVIIVSDGRIAKLYVFLNSKTLIAEAPRCFRRSSAMTGARVGRRI